MEISSWNISPWLFIPLVFLAWVFLLAMVKKVVFAIVRKVAEKTANQIDDILLDSLDLPLSLLVYASGFLVVQHLIPKGDGLDLLKYLLGGFKIICIVAGILFVDRFIQGLIHETSKTMEVLKASSGVVRGFVRVVIFALGALILLDTFGVSVTPIIASLGIGSLAVALALQPTLENFFSGVQIIVDKPVQIGQFIRLETGEEGIVERIGWRSTWIVMGNNNTVILPNKMLVNTRVTNFCYPTTEIAVPVPVGVHYASDLEKVERVTLEVARETLKEVDGAVKAFEPVLRYDELADSAIRFNVILRARNVAASHVVRHDFIKRLQKRYAQEGILIPFPTRTIVKQS
ncbi:MAG: mechanosensitive ion channel family protein [Candidatus Omnitrophica bacterium]|nr:mechanosensitive ion channel family protein [Candidatus Omnitrophota bacterium]